MLERGVDEGEGGTAQLLGLERLCTPFEGDQDRIDAGDRPEHLPADLPGGAERPVPGGFDARAAVDLAAGRRREALPHFGLHHDYAGPKGREFLEQVEQYRHRHVVRQVRDETARIAGQFGDLQRVVADDGERRARVYQLDGQRKLLGEAVIDLHGHDARTNLKQSECEGPEAGADFQHGVSR